MILDQDIILYKGFGDIQSPDPLILATQGSLHFTPYLAVAEFYGQSGFIASYICPFEVEARPHPDNSGPPFNFQPQDYEVLLSPGEIAILEFVSTTKGRLLPGSTIIGPQGNIIFKDTNPPIIFTNPTPYNKSHF